MLVQLAAGAVYMVAVDCGPACCAAGGWCCGPLRLVERLVALRFEQPLCFCAFAAPATLLVPRVFVGAYIGLAPTRAALHSVF